MDIYLDANATTPVLPQARAAALSAMAEEFGNPSSTHARGLRARALLDEVRARARRVLGAPTGRLLFNSGATEGIQTAVLSALDHWRRRRAAGELLPGCLLYGATEHKAVPEALSHWNALLGLDLPLRAIPVGPDGRHDLAWLRRHAADAGIVCTMAANNETGVVTDLDGVADALQGSPALWLVDGVQALGKMPLRLAAQTSGGRRRVDYAPFSGHKLYAPKGVGLLYVREGAPFTPMQVGGGQEGAGRSGTENMAGIAAFGAVLAALEQGGSFASSSVMHERRERLAQALRQAFADVAFNAPFDVSLPTTLNFSVPGRDARLLLNLFDAAGLRLSGGSACSAARAQPSHVLQAMGLPAWRTEAAVRLSFGAADDDTLITEACARLKACGESLREAPQAHARKVSAEPLPQGAGTGPALPADVELPAAALREALLRAAEPRPLLVDVREAYETRLGGAASFEAAEQVPLSELATALPRWAALPAGAPVVFFCRSGNRSAQAARALRRLGHAQAWSLAGGLALWDGVQRADTARDTAPR